MWEETASGVLEAAPRVTPEKVPSSFSTMDGGNHRAVHEGWAVAKLAGDTEATLGALPSETTMSGQESAFFRLLLKKCLLNEKRTKKPIRDM